MSIVKEFIAGLLKKRVAKMVHGIIQELISKKMEGIRPGEMAVIHSGDFPQ
jgi:hypothetical protein